MPTATTTRPLELQDHTPVREVRVPPAPPSDHIRPEDGYTNTPVESIDEAIERNVANAPRLTARQRERVSTVLSAGSQ